MGKNFEVLINKKESHSMIKKVNLGSGPKGKDDWINLDYGVLAILHRFKFIENVLLKYKLFPRGYNFKWPKIKIFDCRKNLPFRSSSVNFIYTSHFIEHLRRCETIHLINECYRALTENGILRIVVPDLELLAEKYLKKDTRYFTHSIFNPLREKIDKDNISLADYFLSSIYPIDDLLPKKNLHSKIFKFFFPFPPIHV